MAQRVVPSAPQPNVIIRDQRDYPNQWSNGLCGLWSHPDCCYACCCTPCYHCRVGYKFGDGCCTATFCAPPMLYRAIYRHKKHIEGGHCMDNLVSAFCMPCTLVQLSDEVEKRGTIYQD